jgi:hypothetical protein
VIGFLRLQGGEGFGIEALLRGGGGMMAMSNAFEK